MAMRVLVVIGIAIATARASQDAVLARLDPGPRYQYVSGENGIELQDLWLKSRDIEEAGYYDPDYHNGYHLFTRSNPSTSQPLPRGYKDTLAKSYYDPRKRTIVLVHGWQNTPTSQFHVVLIPAFLEAEDVNVIMTDWSVGAAGNYLPALLNCIRSGESVAKYLQWLVEESGGDLSRFHLVGHSLGGHQVGIIGRNLGGVVPYITSLDPALPGWITNPNRFKADDGLYTEVMHTNAGVSGFLTALGHVDFYPNGGVNMPGCADRSCSHHRCNYYLAESLKGRFLGSQCDNLASALIGDCDGRTLNMGGLTPKPEYTGLYHVETNAYSPFSKD
ncbi:lipase member H-like [Manduca sexta]|uniref:lipase member H-like n=1 Tax=Manduca sexta TaxID=7130 RepID=UPI00188FBF8D|nr:lipase member H-like [Manduca sexta]XP_037301876.1 lipase member H-like [Manduca sexta]